MKDPRNTFILAVLMMCIIILIMTIFASASLNINTSARAFALYEPSRDVFLDGKNQDMRLSMASTTKIMTGILAIELCDPDESVEIPKEACGIEGSSVYLKPGDKLTVRDLIYSLLLQSANDAACALAYKISGDISEFANLMNAKSAELGLRNTHFDNPHGLDSKTHYTSARDLALLASYALKNSTFKEIVSTNKYIFTIGDKERVLVNHNKLLKSYDGTIGVKTGYTDKSGRCLVSAVNRDGITLIAVTLDDGNDWADHKSMYDNALDSLSAVRISDITPLTFTVPVLGSQSETVKVRIDCPADASVVKLHRNEKPSVSLRLGTPKVAPIKAGEVLGEAVVFIDNTEITRYNVVAEENIKSYNTKRSILF